MNIKREIILGYLAWLEYEPVLARLSPEDRKTGDKHASFSEIALERFLDDASRKQRPDLWRVHLVVKYRNGLHAFLSGTHPQLMRATAECAEVVHEMLLSEDRWGNIQNEMLDAFDKEIANAFAGYGDEEKDFLVGFDANFNNLFGKKQ